MIYYNSSNENIEWFRSEFGELFSEDSLEKKVIGFGPFKTLKFNYSQLDCMSNMLNSDMKGLKGEEIIDKLSDLNGRGGLNELINDLKSLGVVENVYLREHQNGKAILSIDSTEKPNALVQMLRSKTKLGIFVASVTTNTIKISVSR